MGKKDYARAAILRERVLSLRDRAVLEGVAGNARSLVNNQDYDVYSAMREALQRTPDLVGRIRVTRGDVNLLYEMAQGRYGGLFSTEEKERIRRENGCERAPEGRMEQGDFLVDFPEEQVRGFLEQAGGTLEEWGGIDGIEPYLNPN